MDRSREIELEFGERRVISILFADVVQSTQMVAHLDPDDAQDLLDETLDQTIEKIHAFGGYVAKTLGDGVMAVFGTPFPSEDHALRACLAGIAIRDGVSRSSATQAHLRIGIHTGPTIVRWRNNDFGRELNSSGSAVHIAAHIEEMSPVDAVAVSSVTCQMAGASMKTRHLGSIPPSETPAEAIDALELVEIHPAEHLDKRFLGKIPNRLVDREKELATISQLVRDVHEGQSASLAIVGDAGIGKSRIAYEAQLKCSRLNMACETIRGFAVKSDTPFAALRPFLFRLLGNREFLDGNGLRERLRALDLDDGESLGITAFLDESVREGDRWMALNADERNRAIIDGAIKALIHSVNEAPMLLIAEDLYVLDSETKRFLANARTRLADYPLGLIVTSRTNQSELNEVCSRVEILEPLGPEYALQLAETEYKRALNISSQPKASATIVDAIVARAGGLPLALEELARMAASVASEQEFQSTFLPINLENVFDTRLGGLSVTARSVAQAASVLGTEFDLKILRDVAGCQQEEFNAALAVLVESEFMEMLSIGAAAFRHQLMQEACYGGISRKHRGILHKTVYAAITDSADPSYRTDQELARHAHASGNRRGALEHLWNATVRAIGEAAIHSIVALYRKSRLICDEIGPSANVEAANFTLVVFDAFQQLGEQEELVPALEKAKKTMIQQGDERKVIQADIHLAVSHWIRGRHRDGLTCAKRADSMLTNRDDLPLISYLEFTLGNLEFANGHPQQAIERFRKLIGWLSSDLERKRFGAMISIPGAMARAFASWYLTYVGDYDEARHYCKAVERIASDLNHEYTKLLAEIARGCLALRTDDIEEAVATFAKAHENCHAGDFFGVEPSISGWYAQSLLKNGRIGLAQSVLGESKRRGNQEKIRNVGLYVIHESWAKLNIELGELDTARSNIDQAISVAKSNGDPVHTAFGHFERGKLLLQRKELDLAEADFLWSQNEAARMNLMPLYEASKTCLDQIRKI